MTYEIDSWILFGFQKGCVGSVISLGQIVVIICDGADVRFVLKTTSASSVPDLGLYKISTIGDGRRLIPSSALESLTIQPLYQYKQQLHFSLKYMLQEEGDG